MAKMARSSCPIPPYYDFLVNQIRQEAFSEIDSYFEDAPIQKTVTAEKIVEETIRLLRSQGKK